MANMEKGEVELLVNGKPYTLKFGMNAAAVTQQRHKKNGITLLREAGDLDFVSIRALAWLVLQKYHDKEIKTEEQAGNLIDDAGGIKVFLDAIGQLAAMNGDGPDPNQEAQGTIGTGESSTLTLAASA